MRRSNPGRSNIYLSSPKRPDGLWCPFRLLFNGQRDYLPGVKRPRPKAEHLIPSSVDVKYDCSYICYGIVAWPDKILTFFFLKIKMNFTIQMLIKISYVSHEMQWRNLKSFY
jgi:hypothetical protein